MYEVKNLFWDEPYLYLSCTNGIIRRCVLEVEMFNDMEACHCSPVRRHHSGSKNSHKIF